MNRYRELRDRQQKEYNEFSKQHCFYAFSNDQFAEGMRGMGLDPEADKDRVTPIMAGGFILKEQKPALEDLFTRHFKELEDAISADQTGDGFIYEMFIDELNNHEFSYTGDATDAIHACGLLPKEVLENEALNHGLVKAMEYCRKEG